MITVWAPDGVPEVRRGDDLAGLLLRPPGPTDLADGDVVCVTSKVVSKAEGRVVTGDRAAAVAAETRRVVARRGPLSIVVNRLGLTMAAAGVDASNVEPGRVVLLPEDPDASARALREAVATRAGANVAVLVTDTAGRTWREGQTDIAVGAAGLQVLDDHAGRADGYGNELAVTAPAVADELAGAAELAAGQARPPALHRDPRPGRPGARPAATTARARPRCSGRRARTCSGWAPARPSSPRSGPATATVRRSAPRPSPTSWSRSWPSSPGRRSCGATARSRSRPTTRAPAGRPRWRRTPMAGRPSAATPGEFGCGRSTP